MNKKIDDKTLWIALLAIISLAVIIFTFYNIKLIYDINNDVNTAKMQTAVYKNEISVLSSIKAQENEIQTYVQSGEMKIPSEPGEKDIINFVSSKLDESELKSISFKSRTSLENGIVIMPVTVVLNSDYATLIDFIKALTSDSRFYLINSVTLTSSATSSLLSSEIALYAYYK